MKSAIFYSLALFFLLSCKSLPEFKRPIAIYVNTFKVRTAEKELGSYLKLALQEELQNSKNYTVVHDKNDADCNVYGQVYVDDSLGNPSLESKTGKLTALVEFKVRKAKAGNCEILKVMGYRTNLLSSTTVSSVQLKQLASSLATGITNKMVFEHARQYPDLTRAD